MKIKVPNSFLMNSLGSVYFRVFYDIFGFKLSAADRKCSLLTILNFTRDGKALL